MLVDDNDKVPEHSSDNTRIKRHNCLDEEEGPIPGNMGWFYTAKNSPEHQVSYNCSGMLV